MRRRRSYLLRQTTLPTQVLLALSALTLALAISLQVRHPLTRPPQWGVALR